MEIGSPTGGSVQEEATGAKPVEDVREDSAAKRPMPQETAGEDPKSLMQIPKMPWIEVPEMPSSVSSSSDSAYDDEMDLTLLYKRMLLRGPRLKKGGVIKKVRIEEENIKRLLEVRPRDKPKPEHHIPEDFDQLPLKVRSAFVNSMDNVQEAFEYEQYIIDQYFEKGYAEVYAYVTDEGSIMSRGL